MTRAVYIKEWTAALPNTMTGAEGAVNAIQTMAPYVNAKVLDGTELKPFLELRIEEKLIQVKVLMVKLTNIRRKSGQKEIPLKILNQSADGIYVRSEPSDSMSFGDMNKAIIDALGDCRYRFVNIASREYHTCNLHLTIPLAVKEDVVKFQIEALGIRLTDIVTSGGTDGSEVVLHQI